ncbi:hypothetical protein UFOVP240_56 [uncultured Caudovirales phage]|uniref:Uncharacterized protein n=1 Tax=uncultured Caudovirales phage TaxID=2100421 RepID=A0A6J7WVQ2_9CAUD|nr:hypothetical protein UFOVP240_56 [uncultured Caudovirales phage]
MAIVGKNYHTAYMDQIDDFTFQTYDYAIGGKMVVGRVTISETFREMIENGDTSATKKIKYDLIHQMAHFMLENNLVEFTYQDDPITLNRHVSVRAYLAPDDQVKILRVANKIV